MWEFVNPTTVSSAADPALSSGSAAALTADSIAAAAIQLYPNPARGGRFYVNLPISNTGTPAFISIRDVNGKTLLGTQLSTSGYVAWPLPAGNYFVTIRTGRIVTTKKLTIL